MFAPKKLSLSYDSAKNVAHKRINESYATIIEAGDTEINSDKFAKLLK